MACRAGTWRSTLSPAINPGDSNVTRSNRAACCARNCRRIVVAAALLLLATLVSGRETTVAALADDYMAAGGSVELREPVTGDALLAAGSVASNSSVGGDLSAAGGEVAVRATVGDDLYVAGGDVTVDALIGGNARVAGGRVRIMPEARIEGGAAIAGASVTTGGRFGRYLTVAGREVTLGGDIAGDVRIFADELHVQPGTRIGGRLSYRVHGAVDLPADLVVAGGIARESGDAEQRERRRSWIDAGAIGERAGWLWLAGLLGVGLLLAFSLEQFSRRTSRVLAERPGLAMLVGFLVLVCMPPLIMTLFVTLIGIPLALILLLVYLAMVLAAYVVGALFLGDRALELASPGKGATPGRRLGALFLVLVALALVGSIPLLGDLVRFVVLLLGLGGILLAGWSGAGAAPRLPSPAAPG